MVPLTRFSGLVAAGAVVAFVAASPSAHAAEFNQSQPAAASQASNGTECELLRRAISRRACMARLWQEEQVDTAENE